MAGSRISTNAEDITQMDQAAASSFWWMDPRLVKAAWGGWVILLVVISILVGIDPATRSVTPFYREAATDWLNSENMYRPGQHGWLYPPQGAILYVPFVLPPSVAAGEILYRWVIGGLYAWGIWRLARLLHPKGTGGYFPLMTAFIIPVAAGSIRNGQTNTILGAMFVHAAVDLAKCRWWRAVLAVAVALMAKPIAIVFVLLASVLYRRMSWRMAVGVAAVLLVPFVHPDPQYAYEQCKAGLNKILEAGSPGAGSFEDIRGLLYGFRIRLPHEAYLLIRAGAAGGVLGLAWLALQRFGHIKGTLFLLALGTAYLMLFNPRTEGNSYLIVAPAVLAFAVWEHLNDRREWAWVLLGISLGLGFIHMIVGMHLSAARPLMALTFLIYLAVLILQNQRLPSLWTDVGDVSLDGDYTTAHE